MKKYWKMLLCAAIGIATFTACEDVPEPYNIPTEQGGNTPTPTADYILNQTFTSSLGAFTSQSESGSIAWKADSRYGAVITGYDNWDGSGTKSNRPGVTYLISPAIDLTDTDSAYIAIDQAINYAKTTLEADHKLLIAPTSTDEGAMASIVAAEELPMSMEGLGSSFTYATQYMQIPDKYIGQNITIILKHTAHNDYSSTWEVKSIKVAKGTAPKNGGGNTPIEGLKGSGTKDDPYDVASTIKLIAAGPPSAKIYTKGIISKIDEIDTGSFGNATYYISDDGSTKDQLEVYRGYGLGGAKFTSSNDIKLGDEVIVYGQVVIYNSKYEFTQGSQLYSLNGETSGGGSGEPSGDAKGSGTQEDPYNVVAAIANNSGTAWVTGYIVGWIDGKTLADGARFNGSSTVATNIIIADNPDETNIANCMPVQLPAGDVRQALNLMDNPGNYKKSVKLYGSLEKYFGAAGIKSISNYSIDGSSTPEPQPAGEATGDGTLANPYNSVAANNIASALAKDEQTNVAYYIKGKVVSIKEQFGTQYGNTTVFISDDGTTAGQFQVFRAFYLGNRKWTTGDTQLQKGDEIVVYARLTNYMGNTPESVAGKEGQDHGYLYSINGQTEGGNVEPTPQPGGDTKTLADFANGDFETWASDDQPTGWKSASTASSATLAKSTDAHGGSFAVCVKGATTGNKRIAYEEMQLEAGTYTCAFWTKAATSAAASLCPGYAAIGTGTPVYKYDQGDDGKNRYVNDIGANWQQVTYSFTLSETTTVCLIVMNSKTTGTDLLIDDFTITKQ
ncbi:MAG: hypothetical protein IJS59_09340 [Bacteroidaceae bacterium]|nr:hypothetical protein [Bacteroidaceae bacterium]